MINLSLSFPLRRCLLLALPLAGLLAHPAQAQVAFGLAAAVTYNAGSPSFARDVVVADVNNDGLPDLVSVNTSTSTSNTVGVLLGTGAGTFGAVTYYSTGTNSGPQGVTVADVNNDGLPDLVTANNSSNTLGVLLGKSAASGGGFQPVQQYATEPQTQYPSRPYSAAVADVNGDGLPDLVAANFGTNTLGVLLGKSAASGGGFEPVQIYPTSSGGSLPRDVKVADVNGDGLPDLITALSNRGDIGVLLGKSAASGGGFQPVQYYSLGRSDAYPYSVVVADLNADGLPDLVAPLTNYNAVGVLLGRSTANGGGFQPVQTYSTINQQLVDVAVGDLNSDGVLDIVTGSRISSSVGMGVLLGKSAANGGGFQTINFVGVVGGRVQVADVSGDGRPDIVTGSVAVQLNTTGAPVLDFRARTEGSIGATLTLAGINLDRVTSVSFNGTAAAFTIVNASTITTTVPVGATTGPLTVTSPAPYGTSNALAFSLVVLPTALTGTVLNLTTTSAFLRGSVSDNGGAVSLVESGLVYVQGTGLPTLADIRATRITPGSNAFSTTAIGLLPGTTYTVRSYGINSAGLSYGNPVSFTTLTNTSVVSIARADPSPTGVSSVGGSYLRFTVTFAAPVANLTSANFATTGTGNIWSRLITGVSGAGTTYTVTVYTSLAPGPSTGTVGLNLVSTINLVPGLTTPLPFVGEVYTLDNAPPTAVLSSAAGSATSTAPIPFTVTFSEPITGLTASSLSVSNGTITTAVTSTGNAYSFDVTPTANGPVTVSVPANAAQDAAGNGSTAAVPYSITYQPTTAAPTLTLLSPLNGPAGTSVTLTGTNLGGTTGVSFNGTAASSFVVNSPTSITAIVAAGTTTGPVRVTTPSGLATSADNFVVRVAPTTVADAYTTPQGVVLTGNVLSNDLGTSLRAILIIRPTQGTLALNPDGTFSYQPAAGYVGSDSFIYYACDMGTPLLCGNPVAVSITVQSVAPTTVADTYTTPQGVLLAGNVLSNDLGTNLRAILIVRPTQGTLALNPDGSFTYQPAAGYSGSDSFIYYACNLGTPLVCGDPATVSITVGPATSARSAATSAKSAAPATKPGAPAAGSAAELVLTGSPNPFAEHLRLRFALPTAQNYTLALYDAQGRLVQQLASGQAEAGQTQQLDVSTGSFAIGLYLVRLTTATGSQLLKLVKH
jgi:hypothetical protein